MADELPEDTRQWPTDPFAVLGVARGASDNDVKRAYTRLIRRFKPEHHPEQFRLIRDAFEVCRIQAVWYQSEDTDSQEELGPIPDDRPVDEPISVDVNRSVTVIADTATTEPPVRDPIAEKWNRLIDGPDPAAFAELVESATANQNRVDLLLRLYWLLAFHPNLDSERTRHHWLVRAILCSGPHSQAMELYRRELAVNATLAFCGPYETLLDSAPDHLTLSALVRMRIPAAARSVLWDRMASDLIAARRLRFDDDTDWLNLLVAAHDWAAWVPYSAVFKLIEAELQELKHLELSQPWAFDRIEEMRTLAEVTTSMNFPPSVLALIRSIFATHSSPLPEEVERAASAIVNSLMSSWQLFDITSRRSVALMLSRAFELFLGEYGCEDEEYPIHLIQAAAGRLWRLSNLNSPQWRPHLLRFLCEERIDPREFATIHVILKSPLERIMAKQVGEDVGLRLVWLAYRIMKG